MKKALQIRSMAFVLLSSSTIAFSRTYMLARAREIYLSGFDDNLIRNSLPLKLARFPSAEDRGGHSQCSVLGYKERQKVVACADVATCQAGVSTGSR